MSTQEVPDKLVSFDEVIDRLRDELGAMSVKLALSNHDTAFTVEEVEVELQVAVQRSGELGGKLSLHVFEIGTKGTYSDVSTQKVKLKLKPVRHDPKAPIDPKTFKVSR